MLCDVLLCRVCMVGVERCVCVLPTGATKSLVISVCGRSGIQESYLQNPARVGQ